MISTKRKKLPKASLDDFLDELISNPTDVDLQLIGDVQADKSKSSRMIKGQAELLELNAWIDTHNNHPNVDSADFKESQLARRMNGYAFKPKEHEELKPFDKHNLINATLYQKPALNSFVEEVQVAVGEGDAMAGNETGCEDNTASTTTFSPVAMPTSLLAGMDELLLVDSEEPLSSDKEELVSSPATIAAAQAILKLRNGKKPQAPTQEQSNDNDDFTLIDVAAPELPLADDAPKPSESSVEPITDSEQAGTITVAVCTEPYHLSYLDITFNPPASAIAYDDINYVRKPVLAAAGAADDHAITADPADEIKQVFISVPSHDELPANYQDKDDAAFPNEPYDTCYNPFGFTEYDDTYFEGKSTPTEPTDTKAVESDEAYDDNHKKPAEVETATDNTPASPMPEQQSKPKPKREWYWSIDGEIDPNVINSDAATGLTQRHNPAAPMFKKSAGATESAGATNGDAKPPSKPTRERIGLNRTKATSDKPRSKPSSSDSSAVTDADTDTTVNETTSFEHLLSDDIAAGVKKASAKLASPVKTFGSIDDILDDDLDFLESLTADEDKYFDIDNAFATTAAKNAPDEIGKQTPCQDFYMYESHFRTLHKRLESHDLKTIRHTATNLNQGDAFILDGMVGFIQSMGEERVGYQGKHDPRLRLVFDNKTESNILLSTLNKRLYTDPNGRRIIPSADDFADFDTPKAQAKVRTGQIYIVRSLSDNPKLKQIPNLYKIGFTKHTVEERIKNAKRDIAFLESPVEVMIKADYFDGNPRGLESLIHGFLHQQRINITLTGKNGGKYHPQEWFSISLEEAKKVISAIVDHSIIEYRMDNTTDRMVKK